MINTNCHNCGAAKNLGGVQCEYCDTLYAKPSQSFWEIPVARDYIIVDGKPQIVPSYGHSTPGAWDQVLENRSSMAVTMMMLPRRY